MSSRQTLLEFRACFAQAPAAHLEYCELGIRKHFGEGRRNLCRDTFRFLAHGDVANFDLTQEFVSNLSQPPGLPKFILCRLPSRVVAQRHSELREIAERYPAFCERKGGREQVFAWQHDVSGQRILRQEVDDAQGFQAIAFHLLPQWLSVEAVGIALLCEVLHRCRYTQRDCGRL
jgi:hypothetical protein